MEHKFASLDPKILAIWLSTIAVSSFVLLKSQLDKNKQNNQMIRNTKLKFEGIKQTIMGTVNLPELPRELAERIENATITELIQGLDNREFNSEEIVITYIHRIRKVGMPYGAVSNIDFEKALRKAWILDEERLSGKKRGLLHGIPISVKDYFSVKGLPCTIGLSKFINYIQNETSQIVKILKKQGAIVHVLGSVPQGLSSLEVVNNLQIRALNPYDQNRTTGGSSGGDAALVSLGCCALGLGTDLFGSIRIPASFCGIYGFRPTCTRISSYSPSGFINPFPCLATGFGPLAKSVEDCALYMKVACTDTSFNSDPRVIPICWKEETYKDKRNLKIGYVGSNAYWPLPAAMERALEIAKQSLHNRGHELIEIQLPDFDLINELIVCILHNSAVRPNGEAPRHQSKFLYARSWYGRLRNWISKNKESFYWRALNLKSGFNFVKTLAKLTKMKEEFLRRLADLNIDAILAPYPFPAHLHDTYEFLYPGFAYVWFFNLLNCPAGNVPVGYINEDEQYYNETNEEWTKYMNKLMQNSKGLPINVQVIAAPFRDEMCLNVMKQLEEDIPFWGDRKSSKIGFIHKITN
ncbi:unnamed protein product [Blepharisma stoltei]|uniref:Amidase domain-containing protein n=1 Tax=Blepharisma stoltei TaxID=1481888 RepID=A0AAU9K969_9CILI|nr:unnamed protein product [Blepharisma stoltei]